MSAHWKQYIGDAVYADFDGYNIILTTEDGIQTTNRIVLEPEVWNALTVYQKWLLETLLLHKLKNEPTGNQER